MRPVNVKEEVEDVKILSETRKEEEACDPAYPFLLQTPREVNFVIHPAPIHKASPVWMPCRPGFMNEHHLTDH